MVEVPYMVAVSVSKEIVISCRGTGVSACRRGGCQRPASKKEKKTVWMIMAFIDGYRLRIICLLGTLKDNNHLCHDSQCWIRGNGVLLDKNRAFIVVLTVSAMSYTGYN
jgi:hypothetical protein